MSTIDQRVNEAPTITERQPRYAIGQQYMGHGKPPRLMTVTDILRTYNAAGELVRIRYVAQHTLMGQAVTDRDVCETTIALRAHLVA